MILIASIAIAVSALPILILCIGDPKRLRAAGTKAPGMGSGTRRALAFSACLPGLALMLTAQMAAFVLWLGGSALFGWLLSGLFQYQAGAQNPDRAKI